MINYNDNNLSLILWMGGGLKRITNNNLALTAKSFLNEYTKLLIFILH